MTQEYSSVLCGYCEFTDHGCASVNTGPHNICEGRGCEEAYERYCEDVEEPEALEDLF